jgi:hypothetical protein
MVCTERTCGALHILATTTSMPRIAQTLTQAAKQCLDHTVSSNENDDIDNEGNTIDNDSSDIADTYNISNDIRTGRIPSDVLEHSGEGHESLNSNNSNMHARASHADTLSSHNSSIASAHSDTVRS